MKRIIIDILLFIGLLILFSMRIYEYVPAPLQLVALKAMQVSIGVIHAHVVRKLIIPVKIDWKAKGLEAGHYAAITFYIVIPLCYAFGG